MTNHSENLKISDEHFAIAHKLIALNGLTAPTGEEDSRHDEIIANVGEIIEKAVAAFEEQQVIDLFLKSDWGDSEIAGRTWQEKMKSMRDVVGWNLHHAVFQTFGMWGEHLH